VIVECMMTGGQSNKLSSGNRPPPLHTHPATNPCRFSRFNLTQSPGSRAST
jgi:hypothetical protein